MNNLELPMLSYCVIYYEKFKKVMQRTEKEASSCMDMKDQWRFGQTKLDTNILYVMFISISQ